MMRTKSLLRGSTSSAAATAATAAASPLDKKPSSTLSTTSNMTTTTSVSIDECLAPPMTPNDAAGADSEKGPPPDASSLPTVEGDAGTDDLISEYDQLNVSDVLEDDHAGQHPALQKMCVMDCATSQRIVPNSWPPFCMSNECFDGHVMLLIRTPDVDAANNHATVMLDETPQHVSQYFADKKRRFEFQFQIKLKRIPTGPLFLGCELEHPIKVGTITKGLVGFLLAMVRRINPGFHYSWGTSAHPPEKFEKTHLSFPVEASMDRIVITKPGETLPVLGQELFETNESVKRRRKMGAGSVDWNLQDTYTMCLWSAYADWIAWKSLNVPGMSPFSLSRVTGTQPIYLSVYELPHTTPAEYKKIRPPHVQSQLKMYSRWEFSNQDTTVGGLAERVLGRSKLVTERSRLLLSSEQSLPDTESVDSESFETASRITMN